MRVATPESRWGTVLFEAPGWLPDGAQTWRAGFPLWKREQFVLHGGVCSRWSEIKRQAELGVCKGQFGESVKKWTWGHLLPDQV